MVRKWGKRYLFSPKEGYFYVRKGGKYLGSITAPFGTEDFDRQYWEILNGKRAVKTSIAALIDNYRQSDRWQNLKPKSRKSYDVVLNYVTELNGEKDATRVSRRDIVKARDANKHRARFSGQLIAVLSVVFEHGMDIGWVASNPAKGVRKLAIPKDKQRVHVPWTDEACAHFRANANPRALLIFELGLGSVQRPGDLVNFTWDDYNDGALDVTQGKTDKRLWLPCSPRLRDTLEEEKKLLGGSPMASLPIIRSLNGRRMTYSGMYQVMHAERRRLEVTEHDLHAMRYRGVMELAWAGCSDDEIMAYSGHESKEMVVKYAGKARQRMRAMSANEKRSRAQSE